MVNYRVICLHFHTLNFAVFALMAIVVFIVAILRLSYWAIQKTKDHRPRRFADNITMSTYLLSFGARARIRVCCFLRHFSPRGPSRSHFIRSFALAIVHCHRKTCIIYCFFCNSCFSQYDTRYVCEKLIDKILSVSRETQYFSVFFAHPRSVFI